MLYPGEANRLEMKRAHALGLTPRVQPLQLALTLSKPPIDIYSPAGCGIQRRHAVLWLGSFH